MDRSIGFIGGGRITNIFLQAFVNKSKNLNSVYVNETNKKVSENLKTKYAEIEIVDLDTVAGQEIIFIALHPPVIKGILDRLKNVISSQTVIISLAPKLTAGFLSDKLGNKNIVRMIPNATTIINEGVNPIYFSENCSLKIEILDLLSDFGYMFETEETKLEAYAIISAMLPTYFWFQWKEMTEIGIQMGLGENEAKIAVLKTLKASLNTMFNSNLSQEEVFDLIPVKPIGEHESEISEIYRTKLIGLFNKLKP